MVIYVAQNVSVMAAIGLAAVLLAGGFALGYWGRQRRQSVQAATPSSDPRHGDFVCGTPALVEAHYWEVGCALLEQYAADHGGDTHVPRKLKVGTYPLGEWVEWERKWRLGDSERAARLASLGLWGPIELRAPADIDLGGAPMAMGFGKHRSREVRWVVENDPSYIDWILHYRAGPEAVRDEATRIRKQIRSQPEFWATRRALVTESLSPDSLAV
ncbi:MAG: helicase associated domain-containing protein [Chloroflexi bacterium]|nr:helicase associated domain-containing protein [Chloroflexota bacterium]